MSDHKHKFCVDTECECGIKLSVLVQQLQQENERLEEENRLTRGTCIAPPNTPDDLIRLKQENERLVAHGREQVNKITELESNYLHEIAALRAKLEAAHDAIRSCYKQDHCKCFVHFYDVDMSKPSQADRIATLEGLLREVLNTEQLYWIDLENRIKAALDTSIKKHKHSKDVKVDYERGVWGCKCGEVWQEGP